VEWRQWISPGCRVCTILRWNGSYRRVDEPVLPCLDGTTTLHRYARGTVRAFAPRLRSLAGSLLRQLENLSTLYAQFDPGRRGPVSKGSPSSARKLAS
jgi:hypothetical protein